MPLLTLQGMSSSYLSSTPNVYISESGPGFTKNCQAQTRLVVIKTNLSVGNKSWSDLDCCIGPQCHLCHYKPHVSNVFLAQFLEVQALLNLFLVLIYKFHAALLLLL